MSLKTSTKPEQNRQQDDELYRQALDVCGSFNLRKAARTVTQLYDDILQPTGLRSTQLVILLTLALEGQMSLSFLARELLVSSSTLTRNLMPLERDRLIKKSARVKRGKLVSLTQRGRNVLQNSLPHWMKAQQKFTEMVGEQEWEDLRPRLANTVRALRS